MSQRSLDQWLEHIGSIHPREIEMGLARVARVRDELALTWDRPFQGVIIIVGGTNGKGST